MTLYYVLSGYKGSTPKIIQTYKTRKGAEKAKEKRSAFWESVKIIKASAPCLVEISNTEM